MLRWSWKEGTHCPCSSVIFIGIHSKGKQGSFYCVTNSERKGETVTVLRSNSWSGSFSQTHGHICVFVEGADGADD